MAPTRAAKTPPAARAAKAAPSAAANPGTVDTAAAEAPAAKKPKAPAGETLKKADLIEKVTAETGLKRRDVKAVAESLLGVLGRALGEGKNLSLEPLGKIRVARSSENGDARVLTCKLRQKAVAEPAE